MKLNQPNKNRFNLSLIMTIVMVSLFTNNSAFAKISNSVKTNSKDLQEEFTVSNDLKWKFNLSADHTTRELEKSINLKTYLDFNFNNEFNSHIGVFAQPGISFESGQESTYKSEKSSTSNIYLNSAFVEIKFQPIQTQFGLLQPKQFISEQIFNSNNLLGFNSQINFNSIKLQQLFSILPSSVNTLKTSETNNNSTFSATQVQWDLLNTNFLSQIKVGYFYFNDLNSGIASDAATNGNTISLKNNTEYQFNHQYAGPFTELILDYQMFTQWKVGLKYSATKNEKTSDGNNFGHSITLKNLYISKNYSFEVKNNFFRIEPDSIVSPFTHANSFQNNKIGYSNGLWVQPIHQNMKFGMGAGANEMIYQNSLQSAETFYWISMESDYAKF